jgi:hypothetical protein
MFQVFSLSFLGRWKSFTYIGGPLTRLKKWVAVISIILKKKNAIFFITKGLEVIRILYATFYLFCLKVSFL